MELQELQAMVEDYKNALGHELAERAQLAEEEEGLKIYESGLISMAYSDGTIDGKNDRVRKVQEAQVLLNDEDINELKRDIADCAESVRTYEVERKAHEAYIGLVKAWLYSQCGPILAP